MKNVFKVLGITVLIAVIGFSMAACDNGTTGGGGVAKTIVITGLPAAYQYVAIALYPVGTTVDDVANETVDIVAASGVGMPGASGSTYPLYGMDDNPWAGSGSYAVYLVLKTGSNSSESKLYRANSVSFTAATTTVAFSQFTEITSGGTSNYSLDGIWESGGFRVTVSGSTGFIYTVGTNALWQDAINKNYVKVGDQGWRNITSTGNLTWSGQELLVWSNTNSPNVATGTSWDNCTFTLSADGQTLSTYTSGTANPSATWTRSSHTLDGIWELGGFRVTVSGSTGVFSALGTPPSPLWQDAINKNYVKVGDQYWKSLTSTGNLTWSGQELGFTYNTNAPNVATGTGWVNYTFTLSANGQTLSIYTSGVDNSEDTWTRKQ